MAEFNALRKALEDDTASDQSAVYESEGLGPIESWSDDLVVMAAGQGRPEAVAERERRIRGISKVKEPSGAGRAFLEKVTKRIGDFVAEQERIPSPSAGSLRPLFGLPPVGGRQTVAVPVSPRAKEELPASTQTPVAAAASVPKLPLREPKGMDLGVVPVPPPDARPADLLGPFFRPVAEEDLPPEGIRLPIEPGPTLSASVPDTAPTTPRIAPSDLKAPEAQPIPTASAPVTKDAIAPVASVVPSTGPQTPAGKPESMGTPGLPAPSSEGAGGDVLGRLGLGQALVRALEGSGSIIAGRDLRSGAADTLGERMKQIEALRAKREEQGLEQQKAAGFASRLPTLFPGLTQEQQTALREAITAGGSVEDAISLMKQFKGAQVDKEVRQRVNEQALTSAIARYPELATSFDALRSVAGEYGEKDFASMLERAASGKAGFEAKGAATRFMVDKQGRFNQLTPGDVEKQRLQNERLRQQIELDAKSFKIKEDEALKQTYKDDNEKATKLNELAEKEKGFGGYVTLANDLAELEAAAPGFVTRGEAPEWLTSAQQALGQNWPASTDPRVVKFLGAYGKLANAERHRLYGSAQTAGELKAFLQQLNDNPFSAGPDVLAMQMGGFAANVGRRATNTLNRYSNVFGSNVVDRVLGNEFRPLYADSGVFSSFKDPFPAAPAPAAGRQAKPEDMPGKKTLWNKKTGQWVRYTPEQEAKARAAGAVED